MTRTLLLLITFCVFFSPATSAKSVVIVPPSARGVKHKRLVQFTRLMEVEVGYANVFEEVVAFKGNGNRLTRRCLLSRSCLSGIAKNNHANAVITTRVVHRGSKLGFLLSYIDNNRMVRQHKFSLPNDNAEVANNLGQHVTKLLTGKYPSQEGLTQALRVEADEDEQDFVINIPKTNTKKVAKKQHRRR